MNEPTENQSADLPLFESDTEATYSLEIVAELTGVSSQTILQYQEQGLISPVRADTTETHHFDTEALRTLRRIEHLRTKCEMNLSGLKLMLALLDEVERLRTELRSRG